MQLPNFLHFEPFEGLREKMQAEALGSFEAFDPELHLTGDERSQLHRNGYHVPFAWIRLLSDHTLALKNSRVVVVSVGHYHLTDCGDLVAQGPTMAVTHRQPLGDLSVCPKCLHRLRYEGFDAYKERKASHSKQVLKRFSLEQFFRKYPMYPIASHQMTLRFLSSEPLPCRDTPES